MAEQVIITVGTRGQVEVEAAGVTGPGCKALTLPMEEALGTSTRDQKKPEFTKKAIAPQGNQATN